MSPSLDELLGPSGPFAAGLKTFELRPGQIEMARAVDRAMSEQRVLLCEAGTGTGKTLAYLLPALLSGKRVVVSTATRALQEQIARQDIPMIERVLGRTFDTAVMKGLSNYVCRRRFEDFRRSSQASGRSAAARQLPMVERWVQETETGDLAELSSLAETEPIWEQVLSSADTRVGGRCQYYRDCFVTRMREQGTAAKLIVVNHHLFCADLALRGPHPGKVLPDYDVVIFDEAHQLEAVATRFFGVHVSQARIARLARDARHLVSPLFAGADTARILDAVERTHREFWEAMAERHRASQESRFNLDLDGWDPEPWHALDDALDVLVGWADTLRESGRGPSDALDIVSRRAQQIRESLTVAIEGGTGRVGWVELDGRAAAIGSSPVEVGDILYERLFEFAPAVVLTSATLATAGPSSRSKKAATSANGQAPTTPFTFVRQRLGLTAPEIPIDELLLKSPFNFAEHALLYVARDLPAPRTPGFDAAAARRISDLIRLTDGGAFVLTTSLKSMRRLHGLLAAELPEHHLLLQTTRPKHVLLDEFREHGNAVLVATQSFWEGVDVPGGALRLVVLEKIPFQVPTDPLVTAKDQACRGRGGNPFMELHVPAAAINLKQGFGRLIRSSRDRGIVALLDDRAVTKPYGRRLLGALPGAARAEHMDAVREFWVSTEETARATGGT